MYTMFGLREWTERDICVRGIVPMETGSTCYGLNTVAFKVRYSLLQYIICIVCVHVLTHRYSQLAMHLRLYIASGAHGEFEMTPTQ